MHWPATSARWAATVVRLCGGIAILDAENNFNPVAFLQFNTLEMTAAAGGWAGLVAVLEGNLISPWLTSRAGELNTVAVFVSVLFWGWMWDVWGLVLAIPIMVAIKAAADHIEPLQPLGELLGR